MTNQFAELEGLRAVRVKRVTSLQNHSYSRRCKGCHQLVPFGKEYKQVVIRGESIIESYHPSCFEKEFKSGGSGD